ncbi:glycosyltransferase family 4 protein [Halostagnicola sp. A56]|uniref:glycosyltransferase family 4 protein n=1 Tax=Halostagnicola sp. A56 TaxID=1495067 RepID=UPI0004A002DA|nr:glycosyltransferase family 4 protein [Halostagnicola sp. A56]
MSQRGYAVVKAAVGAGDNVAETPDERATVDLVYIINMLDVGGAEIGACRAISGLDDDRYDVTVIALDGCDPTFVERRLPDATTVLDCRQIDDIDGISALLTAITSADVIVGSLFHSALLARVAGVVNRSAVVATWQHNERFKNSFRRTISNLMNPLSDVILADSEPVAAMLRREFGLSSEVVETVPIAGLSMSDFEPRNHRERDPVVVGSVGVLSEQKNYHTLLSVAEMLADEAIVFRIAGDGPKRDELESRIEDLGLENVRLLGHVDDLPAFLNDVDVYAQTSRFEGLCITVVEAMAAGLPVVGSDVSGIAYNVEAAENGYLHDPDDIGGFCTSIRKLANSLSKRRQFGERGRRFVERTYTRDVLIERFERAIRNGSART